jgi:transposase
MPRPRLPVKKVKEILRLRWMCSLSERQIAKSCRVARSTVADYLNRASMAGLSWPLPEDLTQEGLEILLFPARASKPAGRAIPDWALVHSELPGKGVTLRLLWSEYLEANPEGYSYTRFCELYQAWTGGIEPVMRFEHKAGDILYVDYAGMTMPVVDPQTGEVRTAQIFVAALGASYAQRAIMESTGRRSL